ncbi:kinesin-domain-containing protein [Coccomyxa subellipsoidea C-169]|uniref:Kinesin-like protein n=1 Tax=Coccomyxa subellipsoidea (strain C-169) TaxID=574566 RepID=I0YJJ3_COCSC|nr:kinesin-domain-containing protein [Coccomyxa subellipsoidea C-169]EIE18562.1 kinesin-domain-containing protein [Coccomyxa subellipsoidea C-169]|eukprot:XP_005643106.1 kinesin-domain-containing protein [Coccomyxa subellipsoidea C-169]
MASSRNGAVNVQVILRCRPLSKEEVANGTHQVITCNERAREVTVSHNVGGKQLGRSFHFDKVFDPDSGQAKLYRMAIKPIVEEVLEGFNCTIFAYGQTGTGKTYTMEGGPRNSGEGSSGELSDEAGVIPRAIHQIFSILDENDAEYTVKCSFLELYNEETTDLLAVGDAVDQKLKMLEDNGRVVVQGLEEIIVKNKVDIYALLDRGSAKRRTAETLLNKQSSRSHSVFCVTVHMREVSAEGEEVIKTGKLYLVDLAGSENVNRSGAVDARAKEAGLINKSLLTLGRVITALVEKSPHVPYRDSKLTRLLRDSLGGRTKTCVIATIAPTVQCQEETLSTLDYAHRAKNIRNRPEVPTTPVL